MSTGFESPEFQSGSFWSGNALQTQSPAWSLYASSSGLDLSQLVRVQSAVVKSGRQALAVQASAANSIMSGFSTRVENSGNVVTIGADFLLGSSTSQTTWQILAGDSGSIIGGINISRNDGRFELFTVGFPIINTPLVRNTWYRIQFIFNILTQTYSVSLDNTTLASNLPFLNQHRRFESFSLQRGPVVMTSRISTTSRLSGIRMLPTLVRTWKRSARNGTCPACLPWL